MSDGTSKSSPKFGVGVVGTGFGRKAVMPAIVEASGFELVSVCSSRRENAVAAAEQFGAAHATARFQELLDNDEVDVVVVATPPRWHKSMSIDALNAGKHVICEKPMALSVGEAPRCSRWRMNAASPMSSTTNCGTCHPIGSSTSSSADGYIGELRYFDVRACLPLTVDPGCHLPTTRGETTRKKVGGYLSGIFSHYVDMMRLSFGEVAAVHGFASTALTTKPYPKTVGDSGSAK